MKKIYQFLLFLGIAFLIPAGVLAEGSASVSLRPLYVDISSATSTGAVLVKLTGYSTVNVRYRLYSGSNQYNCWDPVTQAYITSNSYAAGPLVLGDPTTLTEFWIPYERGSNAGTTASYRDRVDPYTSNNNTVALPAATEISTAFYLTGNLDGSAEYPLTEKYILLAYAGADLVSATSSDLSTGDFSLTCPDGITIDKVEVRSLLNQLIRDKSGSWSETSGIGSISLADTEPPVWTGGFPFLMNILDTRGDLHVSLNEPGTVYYVVLADGATAPTSAEVKAGVDYGSVTVLVAGSIDVAEGDTEYMEIIKGATPEESYDIYVVAEDLAATPNLQDSPVLLEATMTPARSLTIIAPQPYDTYYVGTEVVFQWTSENINQVVIGGYDYDDGEDFFLSDDQGEVYIIDASLGEFAFTIPNYASTDSIIIRIYDAADTSFYGEVDPVYLVDEVNPSLFLTLPEHGAVDVPLDATLIAAFDEEIYAGTGNVVIRNADNTVFESFDITAEAPGGSIEIQDNLLYIRPTNPFLQTKKYFVEMDAGLVVDYVGNAFEGISGIEAWSFTTVTLPLPIFFDDFNDGDLSPWIAFSVSGDTKEWQIYTDNSARMNGYNSGELEEDWLISPAIDASGYTDLFLEFRNYYNYGSDDADNYLKLFYSVDYDGNTDNLGTAAWTEIEYAKPAISGAWTAVGPITLPEFDVPVYFAFKYHYNTGKYRDWRIDDFSLAGYAPAGSDATLSDLKVDGETIEGFSGGKIDYSVVLPAGTTDPPAITYTTNDPEATAFVTNATDLTGDVAARTSKVSVTAADGVTSRVYSIRFDPIIEVADLAALRAVTDVDRIYTVTGEVVVTAIVPFNNQKFLQDATAAIQIFDAEGIITTTFAEGDGITGITGTLLDYYGMLELIPYEDPGAASSTGNTVTPQVLTISEFKTNFEEYESELVRIEGVTFTAADGSATFANGNNYTISIGAESTILRVHFYNTSVTGAVIPALANVQGIAIWHYDEAKISPRYIEDITDITSVEEITHNRLKIYPSPATDMLTLENMGDVNYLEVINVTGSCVMTRELRGQDRVELNVSDLPRGLYFIRLHSDDATLTGKFVKN